QNTVKLQPTPYNLKCLLGKGLTIKNSDIANGLILSCTVIAFWLLMLHIVAFANNVYLGLSGILSVRVPGHIIYVIIIMYTARLAHDVAKQIIVRHDTILALLSWIGNIDIGALKKRNNGAGDEYGVFHEDEKYFNMLENPTYKQEMSKGALFASDYKLGDCCMPIVGSIAYQLYHMFFSINQLMHEVVSDLGTLK
ncbi:hypothetical protein ACJX0J_008641, partial [Zea mays]